MLGCCVVALVVASVTGAALTDFGTAQAANEPAEPVSRLPGGGGPWTPNNTDASISADGRFVAFTADVFSNAPYVTVRDRIGDTTVALPRSPSTNGAISDNGCVIAYSGVGGDGDDIIAHDRCLVPPVTMLIGFNSNQPFPRPALSADGSVIAVSDGFNVYVFQRSGNAYTFVAAVLPPPGGTVGFAAGGTVSISDDGNVVAFTSGVGGQYNPSPANVSVWIRGNPPTIPHTTQLISRTAAGTGSTGQSYGPSISGDGNLVTFYSFASDLAVGTQPAGQYFVAVFDRSTSTMRLVANNADDPDMSRDGRHIAYNLNFGEIGDIYVATSTSPQPFATIATDLVSYSTAGPPNTTGGSSSSPVISEHGRWVAFHSYEGGSLSADTRFASGWHVWVRQRPAVLGVSPLDFGAVQIGTSFDLGATVTNQGLSGFVITSIGTSGGGFAVVGENCPDVLHPAQSCIVTVRFSPAAVGLSNGQLTVRDDTYPPAPLAYSGALRGVGSAVPVDTTTTTPATTLPPSTPFALVIDPAVVAFEPQAVGVAAPTQIAQVRNSGLSANTVSSVAISGANAADFSIESSSCPGASLAPGATCVVQLGFTPTDAGARAAQLTATGQGGSTASAALTSAALFVPTLEAFPPVASPGQVTTIIGAGFPPSTAIELVWGVGPDVFAVTSDAAGAFKLPVLILRNTLLGPRVVSAVAQAGVFDQVDTDLLVVPGTIQPQGTAAFVQLVTNHVSRG